MGPTREIEASTAFNAPRITPCICRTFGDDVQSFHILTTHNIPPTYYLTERITFRSSSRDNSITIKKQGFCPD
ncbi:unnamed protein product [Sphenostylis stenocarpa]|uniref:Uncharacterized protein n=1 Tax=Sphenostylis stenocarpa TaxID=92480 RepID=A0AA86SYM1_9FABA|nr:unnamed protein product [Sphenostylis stenocarpa]